MNGAQRPKERQRDTDLFYKNGQEIFRHTGFYAETEILKQLTGMGVE